MTLESEAKFKEKLTLGSKNDMRNLMNFNASFSLKSTEELSLMALKKDPNFEQKLTFCLKYEMRNLVKFKLSSGKSENLRFYRLLWRKV